MYGEYGEYPEPTGGVWTLMDAVVPESAVAGRDLDALIAEKVMGWQLSRAFPKARVADGVTYLEDGGYEATLNYEPFRPSTEIADAWWVVQRITRNPYPASVHIECWKDGTYTCQVEPPWVMSYEVRAETAPLAICRAALMYAHGLAVHVGSSE